MTQRTCIAIVDASRARLFVHERAVEVDGMRDELAERVDLVDPARRLPSNELFSDTRTGSNRMGHRHFGYDDGREAHLAAMDTEFARTVVAEIEKLLDATTCHHLAICASPHMLGIIRGLVTYRDSLTIRELARDFVKLSTSELRQQLAAHGMLPPIPDRATRELAPRSNS